MRRGWFVIVACLIAPMLATAAMRHRGWQQVPVFRAGVDLVHLGVTVADRKGALVTDLAPDDFEIYEDGKKQSVRFFAAGAGAGEVETHLGLLLDVSESMGEVEHQSASTKNEQRMLMQQIAEVTGGQAYFPLSKKELDQIYEKVLAEIRAQYTLGYLSTNDRADGAWRKVEVKVVRKDCKV